MSDDIGDAMLAFVRAWIENADRRTDETAAAEVAARNSLETALRHAEERLRADPKHSEEEKR